MIKCLFIISVYIYTFYQHIYSSSAHPTYFTTISHLMLEKKIF